MCELKALLMTSIQDIIPLTQYFPLNYQDNKSINELLIIAKYFNNCGKGVLVHNNKLYYYKTYVPPNPEGKDNQSESLSQSYSDFFIYNLDCNRKKFFLLIFCDLNYTQKDIDNLTNDIFDILDKGAFNGHDLKQSSRDEINSIFEYYQKLSLGIEKNIILNTNNDFNSMNSINDSNNIKIKNGTPKKRIDSRIVLPKSKKSKTNGEVSADIDDFSSIKNSNSNISLMFRYDFNNASFFLENKKIKKIKYFNVLFFFIFLLIMVAIFTLFILF